MEHTIAEHNLPSSRSDHGNSRIYEADPSQTHPVRDSIPNCSHRKPVKNISIRLVDGASRTWRIARSTSAARSENVTCPVPEATNGVALTRTRWIAESVNPLECEHLKRMARARDLTLQLILRSSGFASMSLQRHRSVRRLDQSTHLVG